LQTLIRRWRLPRYECLLSIGGLTYWQPSTFYRVKAAFGGSLSWCLRQAVQGWEVEKKEKKVLTLFFLSGITCFLLAAADFRDRIKTEKNC
jgi:hypothetical protein